MKKLTLMLITLLLLSSCAKTETNAIIELNISAAASLKESMADIETAYKKLHPNTTLLVNLAASGTLQQQIEQGAPVDVFISAGKKQMDELEDKSLLLGNSRFKLLTNSVVLAVPNGSDVADIQDLTTDKVKKIAQGDPAGVPIGQYAQEVLEYYELDEKVLDKIVYGKDAKEILTWVETGNVDAGFLFKTDALGSDKVTVVLETPEESHEPVTYPVAIVKATKQADAAKEFVEFLKTDEVKVIFEKYGFNMAK